MTKMIFVNLPVSDVARSDAFYTAIGCVKDNRFSNEQAVSMQWSDEIVFMLLDKAFYQSFTTREIADTHKTNGAIICLSMDSRAAVDAIVEKAIAAGTREHNEPDDHGFMYGRSFEDPDGHLFAPMHMDLEAAMAAYPDGPAHEPA